MIQRDILKDEIEMFGRVLGKILAELLGTKTAGGLSQVEINQYVASLNEKLNVDMAEFLNLPEHEIKEYLKARNFQPSNLSDFSEIVLELGKSQEASDDPLCAVPYYARVLDLYTLMDETSNTISLERYEKDAWVRKRLEELGEKP